MKNRYEAVDARSLYATASVCMQQLSWRAADELSFSCLCRSRPYVKNTAAVGRVILLHNSAAYKSYIIAR